MALDRRAHVMSFDDSPLELNSHLDSESYNDIIDSLKMSAVRAINRGREVTSKLTKFNQALVAENGYLSSQILKLMDVFANLSVGSNVALVTAYDPYIQTYTSSCNIDTVAGQVTVQHEPGRKWSKVVRYTDTTGHRRPSKDTYITVDSVVKSPNDDVYNILDGRMDDFWLLETAAGTAHTVDIQFPSSIQPYVNSLTLTPFPACSFKLDDVKIYASDGNALTVLPDGIDASDMGVLDLHFAPLSWGNRIALDLTANGSVIGISDLNVFLIDYVEEFAQVVFEVQGLATKTFEWIDEVEMDFGLQGTIAVDPLYNISQEVAVTAYTGTSAQAAAGTLTATTISPATLRGDEPTQLTSAKTTDDRFYIGFKFKKWNGQSPVFKNAKITYRS